MATIVNARDVQLQSASTRLLGLQLGSNVEVPPTNIPGLEDALNIKSVALASTSQIVQKMNDGSYNPTSITVAVQVRGLTNPVTFGIVPGSGTMSVTPVLTDGAFTFTGDQLTSDSVVLRASVTQDGQTYSDDMTFVKVQEGADGIAAILTNENFTFQADSAGNVSSYVGCSGNFKVYQGTVDVTSVCTFAILTNPDAVGATITASGTNAGLYSVNSGFSSGLNQTTVTFRATFGTATVDKTLSLSKAKAGVGGTGLNNAIVYIYQRATSTPTLPSGNVTYTFSTGGLTGLDNGWTATIPAGTNPLYVAAATASNAGATDTIASNEWASPQILAQNGIDGTQGGYTASLFIYQRASSTPALPSATATYTFATSSLTGLNNGWQTTIPAGSQPLYVSTATAFSTGTSDTIAPGEWAAAQILAQNGANGSNGSNGARGSQNFYVAIAGTSYSDALATSTANVGGGPIVWDQVVQYNNAAGFSQTKYWNGTSWVLINAVVDGNLLVTGSVGARSMVVNNGSGNNLWWDPNYKDASNWDYIGDPLPLRVVVTDGASGNTVMRSVTNARSSLRTSQRVPVTVGKQYRVSIKARRSSDANGQLFLRIDPGADATSSRTDYTVLGVEGVSPGTAWGGYSGVWTATSPFLGVWVYLNNAITPVGYMEAQDIRIEELMDSALIVQGGIDADRINSRGLTIRKPDGTIILDASASVPIPSNMVDPAAGWLNSNVTSQSLGIRTLKVVATGGNGVHPVYGGGVSYTLDMDTGGTIGLTARRSYILQEFSQTNFSLVYENTYDVFGNGAIQSPDGLYRNAYTLASDLNYICDNRRGNYIVVRTYDEPQSRRMEGGLPQAMYRCGATASKFGSPNFPYRGAYILIGRAGIGEGGGIEQLSAVGDASGAWAELSMTWAKGSLTVSGGGATRSISDLGFTGDLNASATVQLLVHGTGIVVSGSTATKNLPGDDNWGTGAVYSKDSYAGPAYCSWSPGNQTDVMGGLNTDPTTDANYTSIDAAWFYQAGGNCYVYENGNNVAGPWAASPGDVFSVVHDGVTVRYYQNGVLRKETPWGTTAPVYFDSAFRYNGGVMRNIQFGPVSSNQWNTVGGAGKPQDNATVGATIGTNLSGSFTQTTWNVVMPNALIGLAHINTATIGSLSALTATIGMLRTTSTGARVEISDNLIQVFYSNGQPAVRISS